MSNHHRMLAAVCLLLSACSPSSPTKPGASSAPSAAPSAGSSPAVTSAFTFNVDGKPSGDAGKFQVSSWNGYNADLNWGQQIYTIPSDSLVLVTFQSDGTKGKVDAMTTADVAGINSLFRFAKDPTPYTAKWQKGQSTDPMPGSITIDGTKVTATYKAKLTAEDGSGKSVQLDCAVTDFKYK